LITVSIFLFSPCYAFAAGCRHIEFSYDDYCHFSAAAFSLSPAIVFAAGADYGASLAAFAADAATPRRFHFALRRRMRRFCRAAAIFAAAIATPACLPCHTRRRCRHFTPPFHACPPLSILRRYF
jgi:hypothetical protein